MQHVALDYWTKRNHCLHSCSILPESRYSQGAGAAAQQDILQVRLALLSLDDKYVQAYQQTNEARSALSKWFGAPLDDSVSAPLTQSTQDNAIEVDAILNDSNLSLSSFLTVIESSEPFSILQHHPEATLLQIQTQIEAQNLT